MQALHRGHLSCVISIRHSIENAMPKFILFLCNTLLLGNFAHLITNNGHLNNVKIQILDCAWQKFLPVRVRICFFSIRRQTFDVLLLCRRNYRLPGRNNCSTGFRLLTGRIAPGMIFGHGCGGYEDARGYSLGR